MDSKMVVMKFGGTSLAGASEIRQVGQIIRRFQARRPVVVVSAMAGVTDDLIALADQAVAGQPREVGRRLDRLQARHRSVLRALRLPAAEAERLGRHLEALFSELEGVCHGVMLLRELSQRSLDLISSFGERLSAHLVAAHLKQIGLKSGFVDGRDHIVTDDSHGAATVDFEVTTRHLRRGLLPLLRGGTVPVVTGFIGRTRRGATTTLGRSGSDYTASILGFGLRAREIWIWKEVDGVCTADPSLVPNARVVPRISYQEAAEMAHFGAEVIHPKTMQPARRAGIPIRIKNTFKPAAPGTLITSRAVGHKAPLMVSSIDGMALVTVEGTGIFGQPGMILRLLTPVAMAGTNIYMISMSSSEYNISFAIMQSDVEKTRRALEKDFRDRGFLGEQVARITMEPNMCAVAVVGAGMKGQAGIAGRVFGALGESKVNVVAIAQGSSEYNITVVIRGVDMKRAVRAIHDRLNAGHQAIESRGRRSALRLVARRAR
ncbi:MAG TPA: aspartate kinase [Candidatus Polarisedimenticolia bacterium]|nr:aspartate kinase [Candidatus Polarisedimenticolia bacterium]